MTAPEPAAFDMAPTHWMVSVPDEPRLRLYAAGEPGIEDQIEWARRQSGYTVEELYDRTAIDAKMTRLRERVAELEGVMREAADLLAERTYGNSARSPGHNARVRLEHALTGSRLRAEASADKAKGGVLAPFDPDNYGPPNADGWMRSKDGSHSRRLNTAAAACVPGPVFVAQTGEASALKPDQVSVRVRPNTPATPTPTGARVAGEDAKGGGIYIASKTRHAHQWRQARAGGAPIISTWIDEAGEGESSDLSDLWRRCISEAANAVALVVYREPDDVLKGGWVELGAALARGVPVFAVGIEQFTVANHKGIKHCATIGEALVAASAAAFDTRTAALATAPDPAAIRREALLELYKLYEHHTDKAAASNSAEELLRRTHMAAAIKEAIGAIRTLAGEPTP